MKVLLQLSYMFDFGLRVIIDFHLSFCELELGQVMQEIVCVWDKESLQEVSFLTLVLGL